LGEGFGPPPSSFSAMYDGCPVSRTNADSRSSPRDRVCAFWGALCAALCVWFGSASSALADLGTFQTNYSPAGPVVVNHPQVVVNLYSLLVGQSYRVTVSMYSNNGGLSNLVDQTFTATEATKSLSLTYGGTPVLHAGGYAVNASTPVGWSCTCNFNAYLYKGSVQQASAAVSGKVFSGKALLGGSSYTMFATQPGPWTFDLTAPYDSQPGSGTANIPTDRPDGDGDGIPDVEDPDDDNDGAPDASDSAPNDPTRGGTDTDGDGTNDFTDTDDDNDGVPDAQDNDPLHPPVPDPDTDGDGTSDILDNDDDNDGTPDASDPAPLDPSIPAHNPDPDPGDGDGGSSGGDTINNITNNNTTNNNTTNNNTTNNYGQEINGTLDTGGPAVDAVAAVAGVGDGVGPAPGESDGMDSSNGAVTDAKAIPDAAKGRFNSLSGKLSGWSPFGELSRSGEDFTHFEVSLPKLPPVRVNLPVDNSSIPFFRRACLFCVLVAQVRYVMNILKV